MAGIIFGEGLERAARSEKPLDLDWGNYKKEAPEYWGRLSMEYARRGGWWNHVKGVGAAAMESAVDLAPDTWKGVAFDVATLGLGSATKLTTLSKLGKIARPLQELSKGEKGTEAVIDLFKSGGYREGAQHLSRVLRARRGLEPTVKAIEQANQGIDAWHLGEKALKPLHSTGGPHPHLTQPTKTPSFSLDLGDPGPVNNPLPGSGSDLMRIRIFKSPTRPDSLITRRSPIRTPRSIDDLTAGQRFKLRLPKLGDSLIRRRPATSGQPRSIDDLMAGRRFKLVHSKSLSSKNFGSISPARRSYLGNFQLKRPEVRGLSGSMRRMPPPLISPRRAFVPPLAVFKPAFRR